MSIDFERRAVAIASGGLDSTTMLYHLLDNGFIFTSVVSFNYGQRHKKELDYAAKTCDKLGIKHHIIDLWSSGLTGALVPSGSSLVDPNTDVPDGHYAHETMKQTVVPNRNMIMLSIAGGIAVAEGANVVATGVHAGDHFIYPDCRPDFIEATGQALRLGNEGFGNLYGIIAPFVNSTKADIAYEAIHCEVPFEDTWSCYKGGETHCGRCGTCVERQEAITEAIAKFEFDNPGEFIVDTTVYEDSEFWKTAKADA